jgi:hypothetical protein
MAKTRFHAELEARINIAVENRSKSIASGAASDYAHYRENVGYILGLQEALKLCDDIEAESN